MKPAVRLPLDAESCGYCPASLALLPHPHGPARRGCHLEAWVTLDSSAMRMVPRVRTSHWQGPWLGTEGPQLCVLEGVRFRSPPKGPWPLRQRHREGELYLLRAWCSAKEPGSLEPELCSACEHHWPSGQAWSWLCLSFLRCTTPAEMCRGPGLALPTPRSLCLPRGPRCRRGLGLGPPVPNSGTASPSSEAPLHTASNLKSPNPKAALGLLLPELSAAVTSWPAC